MRTLFLLFLLSPLFSFSQQGIDKPRYSITTYRDSTYLGTITIELFPLIAPLHVNNFDSLVAQNFFDSTAFHRVVPGFVIQGGDPNSISGPISTWGQGQPTQPTVPAEFSAVRHLRGILGAARDTNINSANSQFYICVAPATFLDRNYTVYGKVVSGMEVVDTIVASPRDANDVPLQKISMYIDTAGVNDSVPAAVTLTAPADQSINIVPQSQLFSWSMVADAVLYTTEFSTDSLFSNIVLTRNSGLNQILANGLPGSATYYWRVRANNGGHLSVPSPWRSFSTIPGAATLISPADSSVGVVINPVLSWQTVAGAGQYLLQIASSSNFGVSSIVYSAQGITDTVHQASGLAANTRYYWRIRSFNGSVAGMYSAYFTFETGSTAGVVTDDTGEDFFNLLPNPAHGMVEIVPEAGWAGELHVDILNLSGKLLQSSSFSHLPGNRITIDVSGYPAGVYFVELRKGEQRRLKKLTIQ